MFSSQFLNYLFPKKVLFYRDFRGYTGGHQKVFDYFNHFKQHKAFKADISFSQESLWDDTNPWFPEFQKKQVPFRPEKYDLLFLAGMDWQVLPENREHEQPVINLIQHVRHANPEHPLYQFLNRRAIRIAVSEEVAQAINATGVVNGPVYTISNGHDMPDLVCEKKHDVYILGTKNSSLAVDLAKELERKGVNVLCTASFIPRDQVFHHLSSARIALLLPNPHEAEGFFLPALEAMKYCDLTIVPDCIGNRSFCFDKINCLMPAYQHNDLVQACVLGLKMLQENHFRDTIQQQAHKTVMQHSIEHERNRFYDILQSLDL